ncbi:Trp biosynthesis-associated membrane protein [Actinomadura madurae]|uniref:Trp biosynthesis-associated membrane protein n=1 Tax=Actinomadura madurae TaxID=1993 RepID=UPI0020D24B27|nr:Trp biosynthesis-associated membrane protein [Actinomadura madurae]MCP9955013.1 Trp biosynthesis-associated membrane protein [Actinomadura madurae]MCP9971747.1 Trp biosynthesis-associated membrane protein [Actinomadura madurae]MCP9984248.1 Trp biosynthesis-associated membrane protein [Actinomadura madurae]MCQ0004200.1 Trp biosynthesis-associated membrane protein [Actinomadura madurae]MCQ0020451.1 Trp biosynthesis-associated membrane protein [Actinomadura madurae]
MTPARERGLTALLCAAGAGLALLAAGRTWATVEAREAITPFTQTLTGGDLGGAAGALGWAGLAGLATLFAARGRVRAAAGVLIALFGAGIAYASAAAVQRPSVLSAAGDKSALIRLGADPALDVNLWWMVSVTGGVILAVAGLLTAVRGNRWPGLSSRYERAAPARTTAAPAEDGPAEDDPSAMWRSLDRGEDPTARRNGRP